MSADFTSETDPRGSGAWRSRRPSQPPQKASVGEVSLHRCETFNKILSFLYLGSEEVATEEGNLESLGASYILNATNEENPLFPNGQRPNYHYLSLGPLLDWEEEKIDAHFDKSYAFIEEAKKNDQNVLVYSGAGVSRGSTIVIAYLIKSGHSLREAYELVKKKRPIIEPNEGFAKQLISYEEKLHSNPTMSLADFTFSAD
eukprot:TRINITY_DN1638_c0_g2_i1.p1 TRINITY_DN1638_c0_g2~~TRINITY_DN1638_c0_g2_i1.p1  ORF type:complete len:201 (-),score=51.97 TRINITY_DN1638_c0_g2_i1:273-875(-)